MEGVFQSPLTEGTVPSNLRLLLPRCAAVSHGHVASSASQVADASSTSQSASRSGEPPADSGVGPPGTLQPSHYLLQTDAYTFCGLCVIYYNDTLLSGHARSGETWRRCERTVSLHTF